MIKFKQIFYGHDGQKYKILARSRELSDTAAAMAVEQVSRRLKSLSPREVTWNSFEDEQWHFWVQTSPGIKDCSGRPTVLFHILLLAPNDVKSTVAGKDVFIFSKFQQKPPADRVLVEDIAVSEEELLQSPTVKFQQNVCRKRLSFKTFFIICIATVLLETAAIVYFCTRDSGVQAAVDIERERLTQQEAKNIKDFAEYIGLRSAKPTLQEIKDHIDEYYVKKSKK